MPSSTSPKIGHLSGNAEAFLNVFLCDASTVTLLVTLDCHPE